jgi:hypothetical protein
MPDPASSLTLSVTLGEDSFSASGKPDLVQKAFEEFKALTGHPRDAAAVAPRKDAGSRRSGNGKANGSGAKTSGDLTLPAFLARLKLQGGPQIGTAIVAWSAQYGDEAKLTSSEVEKLWKRTRYKVPSTLGNVTRDLNKAVTKGLLRREGEGRGVVFYANAYEQSEVEKWVADDSG